MPTQAIFDALGDVLTRWTMGTAAVSAAPSAWREALGEPAQQAELRLLALSAQFIGAAVVSAPQGALRRLPDLPPLNLPTLPSAPRALARRVLKDQRSDEGRAVILDFIAQRGWSIHPADWLPSATESDAPDIYAPWRNWVRGNASAPPQDAPTKNRAPRQKSPARSGHATSKEDATELASFFELANKGVLRRRRQLQALPLKTDAQKKRRLELMHQIDFAAFAGALGLLSPELADVWAWGTDTGVDLLFAFMAAQSAPDDLVAALAERCGNEKGSAPLLRILSGRLSSSQRAEFAQRMLRNAESFDDTLRVGGTGCRIEWAIESPAGAALLADVQAATASSSTDEQAQAARIDTDELFALGLLASRSGARAALAKLSTAGLLHADPRLNMIRLNAALEDNGATV